MVKIIKVFIIFLRLPKVAKGSVFQTVYSIDEYYKAEKKKHSCKQGG